MLEQALVPRYRVSVMVKSPIGVVGLKFVTLFLTKVKLCDRDNGQ